MVHTNRILEKYPSHRLEVFKSKARELQTVHRVQLVVPALSVCQNSLTGRKRKDDKICWKVM